MPDMIAVNATTGKDIVAGLSCGDVNECFM